MCPFIKRMKPQDAGEAHDRTANENVLKEDLFWLSQGEMLVCWGERAAENHTDPAALPPV